MAVQTSTARLPAQGIALVVALALVGWTLTGCALVRLKHDLDQGRESAAVVGLVDARASGEGPIVVAACDLGKGREVAHYTILHESGEYELMLPKGRYLIFAFRDGNRNLIYEAGEAFGLHGDAAPVAVPPVGVVFDVDIAIAPGGGDKAGAPPPGTRIAPQAPDTLHSRQAGAIADLDDARFAPENGGKGFWEPGAFFRELGGNIYFLEPYDRGKIPVLFIHGAAGTPSGWRHFVDSLDRTRFQPWFYYYPSGARLSSMSYLLLWKLTHLKAKYRFEQIYFTAHSMGGLVARAFLIHHGHDFPFVKLFISLATPWGGDRMAEHGVRQSPVVIPSWIDMQPEGDFIESLYRTKLPAYVDFYMFYGHRGSRNPFRSNNDGTITLASLLDHRPQSEAKMNYGFDEDHATILSSPAVLAQYHAILDAYDDSASAPSGGYLRTRLTYGFDVEGVRPRPRLVLRPRDGAGTESTPLLSDEAKGATVGPFPAGEYLASIVAPAGRPDRRYVNVSIRAGETTAVDFHVTAEGVIRGCLADPKSLDESTYGLPVNLYRPEDKKIRIQALTLTGDANGVRRRLEPLRGERVVSHDYLIRRTDVCYNECFAIFDLPRGDYTLEVKAQGYRTLRKPIRVVPGIPNKMMVTGLQPE